MAVTATLLDQGATTSNLTAYPTNSVSPAANALLLLFFGDDSTGVFPSSVTGLGLTWEPVALDQRGTSAQAIGCYRAMTGASPSSGAVTVNYAAASAGITYHLMQFEGVTTQGYNGAGALRQRATVEGTQSDQINLEAIDTGNAVAGAAQANTSTAANFTAFGASWTKDGATQAIGTPSQTLATAHDVSSPSTTFDFAWSSASALTAVAVEIVAGGVVAVSTYRQAVDADNPVAWWPCDDPKWSSGEATGTGPDAIDYSGNNRDANSDNIIDFGQAALISTDSGTACKGSGGVGLTAPTAGYIASGNTDVTIETLVKLAPGDVQAFASGLMEFKSSADSSHICIITADNADSLGLGTTGGEIVGLIINSGSTAFAAVVGDPIDDDTPHHVALTSNGSDSIELWLDGVSQGTATLASGSISWAATQQVRLGQSPTALGSGTYVTFAHQAVYSGALSSSRIQAHANAISTVTHTAAASFSASAALTASGARTAVVAAAISATGALSASAQQKHQGAASVSAAGALSASAVRRTHASAAISAAGALTATGVRKINAAASVAAAAVLTAAATAARNASATIAAVATLVATGRLPWDPTSRGSETWTATSKTSETWTSTADRTETWTPTPGGPGD